MRQDQFNNALARDLGPEDLHVGMSAEVSMDVSNDTIDTFAKFSGDFNPLHCNQDFANALGFSHRIAHGAIQQALVSRLIGMFIPGQRSLIKKITTSYLAPVFSGGQIDALGILKSWSKSDHAGQVEVNIKSRDGRLCSVTLVDFTLTRKTETQANSMGGLPYSKAGAHSSRENRLLVLGASSGLFRAMRVQLEERKYSLITIGRTNADFNFDLNEMTSVDWRVILEETAPQAVIHFASLPPVKSTVADINLNLMLQNIRLLIEPLRAIAKIRISETTQSETFIKRFIAVTSAGGRHLLPEKGYEPYAYAKMLQSFFIRDLARELAGCGTTINAIAPSEIAVGMNAGLPTKSQSLLEAKIPSRKLTTADDVLNTLLFLLSPASASITGQEILLTGGRTP